MGGQDTNTWEDMVEKEKQGRQEGVISVSTSEKETEAGPNVARTLGTGKTRRHPPPLLLRAFHPIITLKRPRPLREPRTTQGQPVHGTELPSSSGTARK